MTIGRRLMTGGRASVRALPVLFMLAWAALGGTNALAMSLTTANVVDLLGEANAIVVGRVEVVTDGLDERGIPYTEITLNISETIRGELAGTYTFRQFGLLKPRLTADGRRKMMPGPAGFPKYVPGENVLLFLRPAAAWTGFRMPAGVTHGKFTIAGGRVENGMGNAGLFRDVHLDKGLVTERDKRLLTTAAGPLNPDVFLSFVRRAVEERWIENGRMTGADRPGGPRMPPRPDPGDAQHQTPAGKPTAPNPQTAPPDPNANIALPRSGR
jgi:hypothetical protein